MQSETLPIVVIGGRLFREVDFGPEHGVGRIPVGPLTPPTRSEAQKSADDSPPNDNAIFDSLWPFARPQQVEKTADPNCLDGHLVGPLEAFYGRRV